MIKRGNKKGQFYLIASIIIISLILAFASYINYSRKKGSLEVYQLGAEIEIESEKVIEYIVNTGADPDQTLSNFTKDMDRYVEEKGAEIFFITGNQSDIQGYYYEPSKIQLNSSKNSAQITISLSEDTHLFDIKPGINFYFILQKSIHGENYVFINHEVSITIFEGATPAPMRRK